MKKSYSFFGRTVGGRPKHDPEPSMGKSKIFQRDNVLPLHEAANLGFVSERARFYIEKSAVSPVWQRKLNADTVFTHPGLDKRLKLLFSGEKIFASSPAQRVGVTVRPLVAKCILWALLSQTEKSTFGEFSARVKVKFRKVSGTAFGFSNQTISSVASNLIKARIIQ
ncbi:MAG: hypothetical protein WCW44_01660 [archaeon]